MLMILLIVWVITGLLSMGWTYGYFQVGWPELADRHRIRDRIRAVVFGLLGPIGLAVVLSMDGTVHGWKPIWK